MVELNTLLGVPKSFDTTALVVGNTYTIVKDRERAFPLHIAMLIIDSDWNFYGYGTAHSAVVADRKTTIEFEVLSLFSSNDKAIYKNNFLLAAKKTGEVK